LGFNSFTVAFWFKSSRDYTKTHTPCPPDQVGMHEQEVLFSLGGANGIGIKNYMGYYEVKIGYAPTGGTAETKAITYLFNGVGAVTKDWQHIAVTFDSASNGSLAVYIDGVLGTAYLGDPNPVQTGFKGILPASSSTEIGAQNNGGLFGSVSGFWGGGNVGQYCITEADTTYRTGWPAAGDFDDYVFYKNKVLTAEQILELKTKGIKSLLKGEDPNIGINETKAYTYTIYPNPTSGSFKINSNKSEIVDVKIFGILGKQVLQTRVNTNQDIDISSFEKGVYFVKVNNESVSKMLVK
jgi:hypothetical protein